MYLSSISYLTFPYVFIKWWGLNKANHTLFFQRDCSSSNCSWLLYFQFQLLLNLFVYLLNIFRLNLSQELGLKYLIVLLLQCVCLDLHPSERCLVLASVFPWGRMGLHQITEWALVCQSFRPWLIFWRISSCLRAIHYYAYYSLIFQKV